MGFADQIQTTQDATAHFLKILAIGPPGSGKTKQIKFLQRIGKPFVLSAEGGLLTLRKDKVPFRAVTSMQDLREAYLYVREVLTARNAATAATTDETLDESVRDDAKRALMDDIPDFDWLCLDSVTEIAEVILTHEKAATKDPRQAYGAVIDQMMSLLRSFRDLPINIYCTGQIERIKDEAAGITLYTLAMPGSKLGGKVPYLFDEVFMLHSFTDKDTKKITYAIQTQRDERYEAKDRSGALDAFEDADLGAIVAKIRAS